MVHKIRNSKHEVQNKIQKQQNITSRSSSVPLLIFTSRYTNSAYSFTQHLLTLAQYCEGLLGSIHRGEI